MKNPGILLANAARSSKLPPPTESGPFISPSGWDVIVIVALTSFVALLAIVWAVYFRGRRRRYHRAKIITTSSVPLSSLSLGQASKRKRKRKEKFRSKPTLADTGGLPRPKNSVPEPPPPL